MERAAALPEEAGQYTPETHGDMLELPALDGTRSFREEGKKPFIFWGVLV